MPSQKEQQALVDAAISQACRLIKDKSASQLSLIKSRDALETKLADGWNTLSAPSREDLSEQIRGLNNELKSMDVATLRLPRVRGAASDVAKALRKEFGPNWDVKIKLSGGADREGRRGRR